MDLTIYFQKIRELAASIGAADVVVVSQETPDGGKPGVRTEVPARLAAQMIILGRARLATAKEAKEFREQAVEAKRAADELAAAAKLQLAVVPASELKRLREPGRAKD